MSVGFAEGASQDRERLRLPPLESEHPHGLSASGLLKFSRWSLESTLVCSWGGALGEEFSSVLEECGVQGEQGGDTELVAYNRRKQEAGWGHCHVGHVSEAQVWGVLTSCDSRGQEG